jgi:symplekin
MQRPEHNEISLALVPRDHPLIQAARLEAEASGLLDRILGILHENPRCACLACESLELLLTRKSDALLITATLNSLGSLLKSRASVANKIVNAVLNFNPFKLAALPMTPLNKVYMRSMERTTRSLLQNALKRQPNQPHALRMQQYIERLAQTRLDVFDETGSRKRPLPAESADGVEPTKRQRLGPQTPETQQYPPLLPGPVSHAQLWTLSNEPNANHFDVKAIPHDLVVRILPPLFRALDQNKLNGAVDAVRQRYANLLALANQQVSASGAEDDEDYEPDFPTSETAEQVKNRVEMDTSEEYAVQMPLGPFKLDIPPPLSTEAIRHLNDRAVASLRAPVAFKSGAAPAVGGGDRLTAMAFVERCGLRATLGLGSKPHKSPSKLTDKFRTKILKYILEDWRHRVDLAISWLTEEWETDRELALLAQHNPKANGVKDQKTETPNYKRWLYKFLDDLFAYIGGEAADVRVLIRLLSEVPGLDQTVTDKVKKLALDPERVSITAQALQYLIMFRPAVREMALDALEDIWRNCKLPSTLIH